MQIVLTKKTIEIICAALLAIVTALRNEAGLPNKSNVVIEMRESDTIVGAGEYR